MTALGLMAALHCSPVAHSTLPGSHLPSGDEVVVVLIAASWCHGVTVPGFREAILSLQQALPLEAERKGLAFAFVGVSIDWSLDEGRRFLGSYGPFDETIIGRNWANTAAVEYIWRDNPGQPSVPQIVVIRRRVTAATETMSFGPDVVLGRFLGAKEIMDWAGRRTHL